jgi:kumamolisin
MVLVGLLLTAPMSGALAATPTAGATRIGSAPANQRITIDLPLAAHEAALERFAMEVATPGTPQYGHDESIAALSRRFGASSAARARVLTVLHRAGATGVRIDVTGLFARATLGVAAVQRLFGTDLGEFRTASAARYVAPSGAVSIPADLRGAVTDVIGLNTQPLFSTGQIAPALSDAFARAMPSVRESSADSNVVSGYQTRTGTATGCKRALAGLGFTPNQYLSAYDLSSLQAAGIRGQGERVALIEIDGFSFSDLRGFANCFGLPTPAIKGFLVGLSKPLAPGPEATLDLEVLNAAAPALKQVDVYESGPTAGDVLASLTAPLSNSGSKPDVISASLGACETQTVESIGMDGLDVIEGALADAAASGISVLAASGDNGSSACEANDGSIEPEEAVSYPASSPFVTGVGGTQVILNAANAITQQIVWNDGPTVLHAGGGGPSTVFAKPAYQSGETLSAKRGVPDVSLLADVSPGYEIYCTVKRVCVDKAHTDPWTQVGGTSAASPLLAGGLALVDQYLRRAGRQDVGLANPLLYQIDALPSAGGVISDVTLNGNDLGAYLGAGVGFGCCQAGPGYDLASGLGSVDVGKLAAVAGAIVPPLVSVGVALPTQRHPISAKRLQAQLTCSGACLAGAYARLSIGRRTRATVYSNVYVLRAAGTKLITIALRGATLTKLRAALAAHDRISATVYGVILDPGGNVERSTVGVKLRIAG